MKVYTTEPYAVILSALDKLEAYIRATYGPAGRGILVDTGMYQKVLDDGFMVIDEFELPDPLENAVIKFVREASAKANKRAGDGTTTATLIMIATVRAAIKSGKPVFALIPEIQLAKEQLVAYLRNAVARQVDSSEDLRDIAFSAYRSHADADTVAEVIKGVGRDGFVTVEEGEGLETTAKVTLGMSIPKGFISPYLVPQNGTLELTKPYILLTTSRITSSLSQVIPILSKLGKGSELLIVCDSLENEALTTVIMNHTRGAFNISVIKAPYSDQARLDFLDDLAAVTGAVVFDEARGLKLETMGLGALGKADKVITTKDNTVIVGGSADPEKMKSTVEAVREQLAEQPHNDAIQLRLARLQGGVGVIKVGAATEAEMKNKKAKIDDAVHATQLAYRTGVVPGGAVALTCYETNSPELNEGLKLPRAVLEANGLAAIDPDTEDAFGVVESAVESGVSMACMLLNTGGIITTNDPARTSKV